MKMIRHDYKFMQTVLVLRPIFVQSSHEQLGGAGGLEQGAASPGCGCNKECPFRSDDIKRARVTGNPAAKAAPICVLFAAWLKPRPDTNRPVIGRLHTKHHEAIILRRSILRQII